jgi:hypothetical protein
MALPSRATVELCDPPCEDAPQQLALGEVAQVRTLWERVASNVYAL